MKRFLITGLGLSGFCVLLTLLFFVYIHWGKNFSVSDALAGSEVVLTISLLFAWSVAFFIHAKDRGWF